MLDRVKSVSGTLGSERVNTLRYWETQWLRLFGVRTDHGHWGGWWTSRKQNEKLKEGAWIERSLASIRPWNRTLQQGSTPSVNHWPWEWDSLTGGVLGCLRCQWVKTFSVTVAAIILYRPHFPKTKLHFPSLRITRCKDSYGAPQVLDDQCIRWPREAVGSPLSW